ncbi:hybrid sensor histidine kinase/response regulator [Synoicihabitans lomoniglobus]|uniref:histidine kinase n=1 Tax=Synoicihabitans lomoniglobus TaxID=2909285 RepID=A0AAF0CP83_9BACT|nr:response regulator [Opitutaceae bacterium LMO-M01]WED65751.1 response regulator [Opitutaceae bacterium LMO-M01]
MNQPILHPVCRVLYLEDNTTDADLIRNVLESTDLEIEITTAYNRDQFLAQLDLRCWDIILTDYNLPEFTELEAVQIATERCPNSSTIVVTGTEEEAIAVECLKLGADDYILKDRLLRLPVAIKRAMQQRLIQTEALATETALRESETKLKAIALHSRLMLYTRDEEGCFNFANSQAQLFLGKPVGQLMGSTWVDHVLSTPENRKSLSKLDAPYDSDTMETTVEVELAETSSGIRWIEVRENVSISPEGQKSVVGVAFNITDRKSLEAQLRQTQRLENLGLLAAGVAHDLNNVLSPIMMAGPLLQPTLKGTRHERLLNVLESSANRGAALVKQVLSFARGEDNERSPLQIKHVVRDVVSIIQETFPKNITCEDMIASKIPAVQGNATQIHQVLLNLCVNARDAMPQGGTLSISVAQRDISEIKSKEIVDRGPRHWVVITVSDTGTGIDPEVLSEIWNPFFTTKSKETGTGLGLNTVRGIVTAHHGAIELTSQVGLGTTFEIMLPAIQEEMRAPSLRASTSLYRGSGQQVLIVDDEPLVRDMLSRTLRRHNYQVSIASDGVEALKLINLGGHDLRLVITDIHMPHMSGDVLISVLRKVRPEIKIIASSGHPSSANLSQRPPGERPDVFVPKPFEGAEMLSAIHGLIATDVTPATAAPQ